MNSEGESVNNLRNIHSKRCHKPAKDFLNIKAINQTLLSLSCRINAINY